MQRWLPTILVSSLAAGIIYLADAGYWIEFFNNVQESGCDKVAHFGFVGLLAYFLNVSLDCRIWRNVMLGNFVVGAIFTVEEVSQIWVPNRHFDFLDLGANYLGVWVGGLLARRVFAQHYGSDYSRHSRRHYGRLTFRR